MDVKGYPSRKAGKGQPPKNKNIDTQVEYTKLVHEAIDNNPELKAKLLANADANFTHPFATSKNGADIVGAVKSYIEKNKKI